MINEQLLNFIKERLKNGEDREAISKELLSQGWNDNDLNEAFKALTNSDDIKTNKKKKVFKKNIMDNSCSFAYLHILTKLSLILLGYPIAEKCQETDIFAINGADSLKYVQCYKGYGIGTIIGAPRLHLQNTSAFLVLDKDTGKIKSIINQTELNQVRAFDYFDSPVDLYSIKDGWFVLKERYKHGLYRFIDNKIQKINDVSFFANDIIAYDGNEMYFADFENNKNISTKIMKTNLLTGESTLVIDLSYLKRDIAFPLLYSEKIFKENADLLMTFSIIPEDRITDEDYYSLNLTKKVLTKIRTGTRTYSNSGVGTYNPPPTAYFKDSKEKTSKSFGLKYNSKEAPDFITSLILHLKRIL